MPRERLCKFYSFLNTLGQLAVGFVPMLIYSLILILAVVQSLFGVGILLFGTPILLLMGYEYQEALLYLLPASAAISWSQVWDFRAYKLDGNYRRLFLLLCLPCLVLGMYLTKHFELKTEIKGFVTLMLIVAFILRSSIPLKTKMQNFMRKHLKLALSSMGLIHGLSNMGGSILSPLVSSLYSDKNRVLAGVSFDYAFMASFQLVVLVFIQDHKFSSHYLIGSVISLSVRYLIGKRAFAFAKDESYQRLINGFIFANVVVLILSFR